MKRTSGNQNSQETVEFTLVATGRKDQEVQKTLKKLQGRIRILEEENIALLSKIQNLKNQNRQLDKRVFDLFTISQAGKVFTATPDALRLSEILLSMITERMRVDKASLLLVDEKGETYSVTYSIGLDREDVSEVRYSHKEGLFWQLIVNGDPFSVVDIDGNLRFPTVFEGSDLVRLESTFWIPMKTKDTVVGIITLGCSDITLEDQGFLTKLAGQAAVAFETAFLYRTIEASRRELDRQMHSLKILFDIGQSLNFINDLTKLLELILDQAVQVAEAEKGSLMMLDPSRNELEVRVVRGIDKITEEKIRNGEIKCTSIKLGEGIAGRVARSGRPLLIEDTSTDERFLASSNSNVQNILCVPLKVYEDTLGVINISNKKGGKTFTQEDERIIMSLADQAAVAINNAKLYELAVTDSLTKLFIRRHFMQRLEEEFRRSKRYGHKLSLLMMDLDHFKDLNDTYGHQAGDMVLVETSKVFKRSIRTSDIAARYGGEEFCIMLPETNTTGALCIAERLRREVENANIYFQDNNIRTTISIGIATFPNDKPETPQELIRKADEALYKSKNLGRNIVTSNSPPEDENGCFLPEIDSEEILDLPDLHTITDH